MDDSKNDDAKTGIDAGKNQYDDSHIDVFDVVEKEDVKILKPKLVGVC